MRFAACVAGPFTVTVKVPLAVFPALSVAVQATFVIPIAKVEPELGAHTTASPTPELSVAVAVNVTIAPAGLVASANILLGKFKAGGVTLAGVNASSVLKK